MSAQSKNLKCPRKECGTIAGYCQECGKCFYHCHCDNGHCHICGSNCCSNCGLCSKVACHCFIDVETYQE